MAQRGAGRNERFERLLQAPAMCMGIESVIVLKDICGLPDAEAEAVKRWATRALLHAALGEIPKP